MYSLFDLGGALALVTGSSQGIGLALAEGLAAHGAKIVTSGIDASPISFALRHSWFIDGKILRIRMCRDKIYGQLIVVTIAEKVVDPYRAPRNCEGIERLSGSVRSLQRFTIHIKVACGRSADPKLRIYFLDRLRRHFIQLEVFFLRAAAKK